VPLGIGHRPLEKATRQQTLHSRVTSPRRSKSWTPKVRAARNLRRRAASPGCPRLPGTLSPARSRHVHFACSRGVSNKYARYFQQARAGLQTSVIRYTARLTMHAPTGLLPHTPPRKSASRGMRNARASRYPARRPLEGPSPATKTRPEPDERSQRARAWQCCLQASRLTLLKASRLNPGEAHG
jgi:hypothetical protein